MPLHCDCRHDACAAGRADENRDSFSAQLEPPPPQREQLERKEEQLQRLEQEARGASTGQVTLMLVA